MGRNGLRSKQWAQAAEQSKPDKRRDKDTSKDVPFGPAGEPTEISTPVPDLPADPPAAAAAPAPTPVDPVPPAAGIFGSIFGIN